MKFHILDVFAETHYSGNQLAVFLCRKPISGEDMQRIAREINFSESAFVTTEEENGNGWPVRIFTPLHEVDFAGHPTLGTAFVVHARLAQHPAARLRLGLKLGTIPVDVPYEKDAPYWMEQAPPVFGGTHPAKALADVLGLPPEAIDTRFPIEEVSTGLPHILVPLRDLESLKIAKIDRDRYFRFIEKTPAKNILVYCLQGRSPSHEISVRMFADYLGIPEDPATGSGNGCLAGYLVKHRCLGSRSVSLRAGQGHEIGRPSLLFLEAEENQGGIHIRVGGRVKEIASGQWHTRH